MKNVLVLGGGVGGLVASNILKRKARNNVKVTVIDRKKQFQFPPSFAWLMLGMRRPEQVQRPLDLLKRKEIEVLNEEVRSIDIGGNAVRTDKQTLQFDYLVVALGSEYDPDLIPGFREHAHHIYDLDSAARFGEAIEKFDHGTLAIGISRLPFKCPPAPYEVSLLLDDYYTRRKARKRIKFEFFTPEVMPVPAVGPEIGCKVLKFLQSRRINYHPKMKLAEIRDNEARFENGETIPYDLLFCVPPHRAPKSVAEAGLVDETGWVPVDPETLETRHKNVYAIGDVASVPTPNGYVPFLPKAGVFAHGQAEVVANNIAAEINGKNMTKHYDGHGACFLEVGGGKGGFLEGNFFGDRPSIKFRMPAKTWHMEKILFEKYWLRHWF